MKNLQPPTLQPIEIPSYAFDHQRYWISDDLKQIKDINQVGQEAVTIKQIFDHPFIAYLW